MKYGAHCYIWTDHWADGQVYLLDTARELGLNVMELAIGDDVHFTPRLTRQRAESLGLELITSPGGLWPLDCDLSSDLKQGRARGLEWHKQQVDLAQALGAETYAGALYGHPGVVKRRRPLESEYGWTAEGLHSLAEYAAGHGVRVVLEPMSHFRSHVANTPQQIMRLIELADHSNLFILLDTYHLLTEILDYADAICSVRPRLWGIHACENDRGAPGRGLIPWASIFGALVDTHFDGYIGFEAYNSSLDDFAFARGMFHNVCPDGDAFVRQALAFVKQGIEAAKEMNKAHERSANRRRAAKSL
jgi:D-psicose/D-tagatose/L-ribulose 3-epimerase